MEFNPLDVATKELIWDEPADWLERFGIDPGGPVELIDSEATTLTAAADKVLKVGGDRPFLVDLEPHSYHETDVVRKLWLRQVALDHRHNLPVLTVLILLRKEANSPGLRGVYERKLPDGRLMNRYHYRVVRLWKEDPEDYLNAGVAVLPLAPLTDVVRADLPGVIDRMTPRINAEPPARAAKIWLATYLLMGMRYPDDLINRLLEGRHNMQDSTTYQRILRDGRQEGLKEGLKEGLQEGRILGERQFVLRLGTKRFGEPGARTLAAIEAIRDADRLEALGLRIIDADVRTWDDLLRGA